MRTGNPLYLHLGHLFRYPDEEYLQHLDHVAQALAKGEVKEMLEPLRSFVAHSDFTELEELFTRTFAMNPLTCLEVGWHLYGEDYKRGEFLVKMRQALAQYDLPESEELPDHMSHCLQLLAYMEPQEAPVLAEGYLLPALKKILKGLKPENPFRGLLEGLERLFVDLIGPGSGYIPQESGIGQGVSNLVSLEVD
jgi:nitrate reductase molybdenum cofactor assembly chaperone